MNNPKQNSWITPQVTNFAQWYTDVCYHSAMFDYGPVRGTIIFKPYGLALWNNIRAYLNPILEQLGVQNVYFPMLIPRNVLEKEYQHIKGFSPELATVTKVGDKNLEQELYIRPTSEVLMCTQFAKSIKSYRDLPLMYNQWCNVMRWEKNTRPFLRTNEFLWQEGHTVHNSRQEANQFSLEILNIYGDLLEKYLAIPVIKGQKTTNEKFAGALNSYSIETLMPDGQALQCGTTHYFGQVFSKIFNIKFENFDQKQEYAYSTSWGVSTRLLGAIVMSHGDDKGLVLPFAVAPIQIQIILLNYKSPDLIKYGQNLYEILRKEYKVSLVTSNKSFGYQIKQAEVKGIPLRLELGFKNLSVNTVTIARRDNNTKSEIKLQNLREAIADLKIKYNQNLYRKAMTNLKRRTIVLNTFDQYRELIKTKNILALVPFCGRVICEQKVKELTNSNSRCIPFAYADNLTDNPACFKCHQLNALWTYFGKAY